MTRLTGAALVALSGLLTGLWAAARQREGIRRCEALCRMLELAALEILRFHTPLPELFPALALQLEEPAAGLCLAAAEGLARGEPFAAVWDRCVSSLPRPERERLAPLGRVLGRYGAEEQAAAMEACRRSLEERAAERRSELRERSRVYIGVGAAGGVMLAVLLL